MGFFSPPIDQLYRAGVLIYQDIRKAKRKKQRERDQKRRFDELRIELALRNAKEGPYYPDDEARLQATPDKTKGRINPHYPQDSAYNQVTPAAKKG